MNKRIINLIITHLVFIFVLFLSSYLYINFAEDTWADFPTFITSLFFSVGLFIKAVWDTLTYIEESL